MFERQTHPVSKALAFGYQLLGLSEVGPSEKVDFLFELMWENYALYDRSFDKGKFSNLYPQLDDIPWCSIGMLFLFTLSGISSSGITPLASSWINALIHGYGKAEKYVFGKTVAPSMNDLIILKPTTTSSGHISLVISSHDVTNNGSLSKTYFKCLGGNQQDSFSIAMYDSQSVAYIRRCVF